MRVLFSKGIAAISKPRCGSTSVRQMLDPFISDRAGDIAVNVAGENPPFHPHITAPYLKKMLVEKNCDINKLRFFVVIRNPLEMLWSYYKFFQPDGESRYTFSQGWEGRTNLSFGQWIRFGKVGINPEWRKLCPEWISEHDLTPLSLEAHAMDREGKLVVDKVFKLEQFDEVISWLEHKLDQKLVSRHVNVSSQSDVPRISEEELVRVRKMFPFESEAYNI